MSKSLGNGVLVKDLRTQYKREAIRYFMLSTHYRNPLNFTEDTMEQAQNSVDRIANAVGNLKHRLQAVTVDQDITAEFAAKLEQIRQQYHEKMQDDFNTPDAITALFEWAAEANHCCKRKS